MKFTWNSVYFGQNDTCQNIFGNFRNLWEYNSAEYFKIFQNIILQRVFGDLDLFFFFFGN